VSSLGFFPLLTMSMPVCFPHDDDESVPGTVGMPGCLTSMWLKPLSALLVSL